MPSAAGARRPGRPRLSRRRKMRVVPQRRSTHARQRRAEASAEPMRMNSAASAADVGQMLGAADRGEQDAQRVDGGVAGRRVRRKHGSSATRPGAASRHGSGSARRALIAERDPLACRGRRAFSRASSRAARSPSRAHARPLVVAVDIGRIVDPADAAARARQSRNAARPRAEQRPQRTRRAVEQRRRRHAGEAAAIAALRRAPRIAPSRPGRRAYGRSGRGRCLPHAAASASSR